MSASIATPSLAPPLTRARLAALVADLEAGLIERAAVVRLALLAALAGEHILLIGPPGTAKSALARRLQHAFAGARYFERLLTRFSVPEELFGPLSLKALEDDRYERLTDGYLPTAGIAFLDEVFKANSAILNALLTLLNEREFDNGSGRLATPLVCVVGASNEVPGDEALQAFYDRFLLRVPVEPVSDASFQALLALGDAGLSPPSSAPPIEPAERTALLARRDAVALTADVTAALAAARALVQERGITVSDRRWRQTVALLKTAAASSGRDSVEMLDLWVLPYCLAERPEQVEPLTQWVHDECLGAKPVAAAWLERAVEAFERQLEIETTPRQDDDGEAGKMALARSLSRPAASATGTSEQGMARIVSASLQQRLAPRYGPLHIQARVAQVDELMGKSTEHLAALTARADAAAVALRRSPWLPAALAAAIGEAHAASVQTLVALLARLRAAQHGFASLPVNPLLAGDTAPEPVRWPDAATA